SDQLARGLLGECADLRRRLPARRALPLQRGRRAYRPGRRRGVEPTCETSHETARAFRLPRRGAARRELRDAAVFRLAGADVWLGLAADADRAQHRHRFLAALSSLAARRTLPAAGPAALWQPALRDGQLLGVLLLDGHDRGALPAAVLPGRRAGLLALRLSPAAHTLPPHDAGHSAALRLPLRPLRLAPPGDGRDADRGGEPGEPEHARPDLDLRADRA